MPKSFEKAELAQQSDRPYDSILETAFKKMMQMNEYYLSRGFLNPHTVFWPPLLKRDTSKIG